MYVPLGHSGSLVQFSSAENEVSCHSNGNTINIYGSKIIVILLRVSN